MHFHFNVRFSGFRCSRLIALDLLMLLVLLVLIGRPYKNVYYLLFTRHSK